MTRIYGTAGADGKRFAYPLLLAAAADAWGWRALPRIERSQRGKPFFPDRPDRWFSISHSGGYALCALSGAGAVGVDIEGIRPRRAGLPEWCLSPAELSRFDGSWRDFYRFWTLKEAWCKREDIPLCPPARLVTPPPCPHKGYEGADWAAAVCCADSPPGEIVWVTL